MFLIYFSNDKEKHNDKTPSVKTKDYYNAVLCYIALSKVYSHVAIYEKRELVIKHFEFAE
jgi:hypothetical protein